MVTSTVPIADEQHFFVDQSAGAAHAAPRRGPIPNCAGRPLSCCASLPLNIWRRLHVVIALHGQIFQSDKRSRARTGFCALAATVASTGSKNRRSRRESFHTTQSYRRDDASSRAVIGREASAGRTVRPSRCSATRRPVLPLRSHRRRRGSYAPRPRGSSVTRRGRLTSAPPRRTPSA